MSTPTPGTWFVFNAGPLMFGGSDLIVSGEREDAIIASMGHDVPETEANERLIIAAPQMQDGLRRITDLASGWDDDGAMGPKEPYSWETVARMAMDIARAALALTTFHEFNAWAEDADLCSTCGQDRRHRAHFAEVVVK